MTSKRKAEGHSRTMGKQRTTNSGGSRTESERDSGFSDAGSEHMSTVDKTDSEASHRSVAQRGSQHSGSGSQTSQLAVVGGSYPSMSPMIIMNNVLLKQPGPAVEVVQPVVQQPQVVFLQPVVSQRTPSVIKEGSAKRRRPKKYLPILKSYPKIAPHPGDSSSSSGRGSSSSFSSGSERSSSSVSSLRERHHHRDKPHKRHLSGSSCSSSATVPCLPPPLSSLSPSAQQRLTPTVTDSSTCSSPAKDRPSPAVTRSELFTPSPSLSSTPSHQTEDPNHKTQALSLPQPDDISNDDSSQSDSNQEDSDSGFQNKRKRFCNTYNILSKSGLLDIALRTKELLRQNRRSQGELDRLREHTSLFLQTLQTGDSSVWAKLQASLQEENREKEREKEKVSKSTLQAD